MTLCVHICGVCLVVLWQGAMGRPLSFRVNCPLIGTLREVSGEGYHVFVQSVPWFTLKRVPEEGLSC